MRTSSDAIHAVDSAPHRIVSLASPELEYRPRLSPDELTIHFKRTDTSDSVTHIYTAHRTSLEAPFSTPELMPDVNSAFADEDLTISADGTTGFFSTSRATNGRSLDVFVATRASAAAPFGAAALLTNVNSPGDDTHAFLRRDGQELWFASNRLTAPGGTKDLYRSVRTSDGVAVPLRVAELSAAEDDGCPVLSADGLLEPAGKPGRTGHLDVHPPGSPGGVHRAGARAGAELPRRGHARLTLRRQLSPPPFERRVHRHARYLRRHAPLSVAVAVRSRGRLPPTSVRAGIVSRISLRGPQARRAPCSSPRRRRRKGAWRASSGACRRRRGRISCPSRDSTRSCR